MQRMKPPRYEWVEAWGERVRDERIKRGWSIDELAHKVQVTRTTIFRIEKGDLNPNEALKARISNQFGIRMDLLWSYPAIVAPWYGAEALVS